MEAAIAGNANEASDLLRNHYRETGAFLAGQLDDVELG
jgi:DNA-binding GntR family transcriptional regulator